MLLAGSEAAASGLGQACDAARAYGPRQHVVAKRMSAVRQQCRTPSTGSELHLLQRFVASSSGKKAVLAVFVCAFIGGNRGGGGFQPRPSLPSLLSPPNWGEVLG